MRDAIHHLCASEPAFSNVYVIIICGFVDRMSTLVVFTSVFVSSHFIPDTVFVQYASWLA